MALPFPRREGVREGRAATDEIVKAAEVRDIGQVTKGLASKLIDAWKSDAQGDDRAA